MTHFEDANRPMSLYVDYFLYGLNHSNRLENVSGHDEYMYGRFPIPAGGYPVFNSTSFVQFYINSNGYVSLTSAQFDLNIFPFESDIDLRQNGVITHGPIVQEDLLYSVGLDIARTCQLGYFFRPTWTYIISWFEVRPYFFSNGDYLYGAKSSYKNTFQLILTTDQVYSFAILNYVRFDWPNVLIPRAFQAGYSVFYHANSTSIKHVFENSSTANLLANSNIHRPGKRIFTFNNTKCSPDFN